MENLSCCVYTCVSLLDVLLIQKLLASLIHVRCARLNFMMNKEILSTALKVCSVPIVNLVSRVNVIYSFTHV